MTSRRVGLGLGVVAAALLFWFIRTRVGEPKSTEVRPAGGEVEARAVREGESGGRPAEVERPNATPRTDVLRRSGELPQSDGGTFLLRRARAILDTYREERDPGLLGALLRPRPLPELVREALRVTAGFPVQEQARAVAALRRFDSPELRRILESTASDDADPAVRNLALETLEALDQK